MGKVSERLAIADRVGLELQNRYSYEEIDIYLEAFGLPTPAGHQNEYYDRRDYAKSVLSKSSISVLAEMVDDLGIESFMSIVTKAVTPNIWKDDGKLRVFVSHLSSEKHKAMRIRDALAAYGMSAFVAHEDIEPTLEWQVQIERALHSMELFISVHTPKFRDSIWTQQEVGFAVGRGVKIIAVRMGEDPVGFISKHQALSRGGKKGRRNCK